MGTRHLTRSAFGATAMIAALALTGAIDTTANADTTSGPQTTVDGCSLQGGCPASAYEAPTTTPAESGAVNWARGQLGQDIDSGYCLRFLVNAYANGGGVDIGSAYNAVDYWNEHADRQHPGDTNPPPGALVFWDAMDGYPDGHVAIAEGGDTVISTTERSSTGVHEFSIADRNATKPYLGWLMPD